MNAQAVSAVAVETRLDADALATIAAGIAATAVPWEARTGQVPVERCYEQLLATDSYEVWVICWPEGGTLDLHDHGGSAGAFQVVSGHLDEARVDGGRISVRHLGPGDAVTFPSDHVHAVANRSTQPATSVHVYSPPLGPMGFYEWNADGTVVTVTR